MEITYIVNRRSYRDRRHSVDYDEAANSSSIHIEKRSTDRRTMKDHPGLVVFANERELEMQLCSLNDLEHCEFYTTFDELAHLSKIRVAH